MAIAGLFPGQGSQSSGMLAELAASHSVVTETFQQTSDILGRDLWAMAQSGTEAELNNTENTQPLMLAAGVACLRVWQEQGGKTVSALAGHSLGEYSALVAAGTLDYSDAVKLVAERSSLMQSAVPAGVGGMAAILGLEDVQVVEACAQAAQGEVVEAVNFNSPGQVVIGGSAAAVERAIAVATDLGAKKAIPLAMSVPSHCSLMQPVAEKLGATLTQTAFNSPGVPVLHNVDAQSRQTPDEMRSAVSEQLYQPVRWVDTIRNLQQHYDIDIMVEFGPGKVLTGLNRRIERRMKAACIFDNKSLDAALALCGETT